MTQAKNRNEPPAVPIEYAGKWIAWNRAQTEIVAAGDTLSEVRLAAGEAGEAEPIFAKVPRADVRFVGAGA